MPSPVQVTVLGSGDAFASGGRLHSAYLVESPEATFLVDCGATVMQGLKRHGIDPARIDFVLLSHLHGDHFGGVPFLFMDFLYESERTRPVTIYGPPQTERRVRALFTALYERQGSEPMPFGVSYVELPAAGTSIASGTGQALVTATAMATELAPFGITVNAFAPGFTNTEAALRSMPEEMAPIIKQLAPLGRGTPEDVHGALLLLTSPSGTWMTGQTLNVDGGWVMRI
jgi:ribonuclease BN (tRNA processing enzyme)